VKILTTPKPTVEREHLQVAVKEDQETRQKSRRGSIKEKTERSSDPSPSDFFVSPLREPLTDEEVSYIWRSARE
jgi:hypothetical protein